jgi:hypothetical protein
MSAMYLNMTHTRAYAKMTVHQYLHNEIHVQIRQSHANF